MGTWTQKVKRPLSPSPINVSQPGGDFYFMSESSAAYSYAQQMIDPKYVPYGYTEEIVMGDFNSNVLIGNREDSTTLKYTQFVGVNRIRNVGGTEVVNITGIQTVKANKIFLN